jgi:general nucleoside transport system permease protein
VDPIVFAASVIAASPPIVLAVLGETITEKSGVINLSLDGSILLAAMAAFAVAFRTGSLAVGFGMGAAVGACVALVIAVLSLTLHQSQVATGFVLTLLCRDLAYVLGNPYAHVPGPQVPHAPVPGLAQVPILGPVLFSHDIVVYCSLAVTVLTWAYVYKTLPGLGLRGLGERPAAAFARGFDVTGLRYLYTAVGGALVGLGGASYSLLVKPGWARPYGIEGTGWIALAIVIFGGWRPVRAAVGACGFVALQTVATTLQSRLPQVPTQVFPTLPFPIMILMLLAVSLGDADWVSNALGRLPPPVRQVAIRALRSLGTSPPAALGTVGEDTIT